MTDDILWVARDEPLTFRRGSRPDPLHDDHTRDVPFGDPEETLRDVARRVAEPVWSDLLVQIADRIHGIVVLNKEVPVLREALASVERDLEEASGKIDKLETVKSVQYAREQARQIRQMEKELGEKTKEVKELDEQLKTLTEEGVDDARGDRYRHLLERHLVFLEVFSGATHTNMSHEGTFPACRDYICRSAQRQIEEWWANTIEATLYEINRQGRDYGDG